MPDGAAVVAYFGDGATSEGDVHESMVSPPATSRPVVFFCQNNHWAISVPTRSAVAVPLPTAPPATASPASGWTAMTWSPSCAVTRLGARARPSGKGPVLIEAFTYRMSAHTTADDPTKYREAEEEAWARQAIRCPAGTAPAHARASPTRPSSTRSPRDGDELAATRRATRRWRCPGPTLEDLRQRLRERTPSIAGGAGVAPGIRGRFAQEQHRPAGRGPVMTTR